MTAASFMACLALWIPPDTGDGFDSTSEYSVQGATFVSILRSERQEGVGDLILLEEGGYLLVGGYWSCNWDSIYSYAVRVNDYGGVLWEKRFRGDDMLAFLSVSRVDGDEFMVSGNSYSDPLKHGFVYRLDSELDEVWSREYAYGRIQAMIPVDSRFVIAAETGDFPFWGEDVIAALDGEGDVIWSLPVGEIGMDFCTSLDVMASGDFFVGGMRLALEDARREGTGFVSRVTGEGTELWRTSTNIETYGTNIVAASESGRSVLGGGVCSRDTLYFSCFDPDGGALWNTSLNCSLHAMFLKDMMFLSDGSVIAAGSGEDPQDGMRGYLMILHLSEDGEPLRGLIIKAPGYMHSTAEVLCPRHEDGFVTAALISGYDPEVFDVLLMGFDRGLNIPGSSLQIRELEFTEVSDRSWEITQPEGFQ